MRAFVRASMHARIALRTQAQHPTHTPVQPRACMHHRYRKLLDVSADDDPKVVAPEHGTPTAPEFRKLLEYTESWTHWPDHERVGGRWVCLLCTTARLLSKSLEPLLPTQKHAPRVRLRRCP